jgi:hypothetical protein
MAWGGSPDALARPGRLWSKRLPARSTKPIGSSVRRVAVEPPHFYDVRTIMSNTYHDYVMKMDRASFIAALEKAEIEREGADELLVWGTRLLPYLDRNPTWTLEQAVDTYKAEHGDTR